MEPKKKTIVTNVYKEEQTEEQIVEANVEIVLDMPIPETEDEEEK